MTDTESYIDGGVLNLTWLAVTFAGIVGVHMIWPHRSWSWGLLLGACIGASGMTVVAYLVDTKENSDR